MSWSLYFHTNYCHNKNQWCGSGPDFIESGSFRCMFFPVMRIRTFLVTWIRIRISEKRNGSVSWSLVEKNTPEIKSSYLDYLKTDNFFLKRIIIKLKLHDPPLPFAPPPPLFPKEKILSLKCQQMYPFSVHI